MKESSDTLRSGESIRAMFSVVARRYDFLNTVLSFGMDARWRRALVAEALKGRPDWVVDVATGSGAVVAALRQGMRNQDIPGNVVGVDFCLPMLREAQRRGRKGVVLGDAARLPLADAKAGAITVAFGLRNFPDRTAFFKEAARVLVPTGRLCILEFSQPHPRFAPLFHGLLNGAMPRMAALLGGSGDAYRYLADSIQHFPSAEGLTSSLVAAGYREVRVQKFFLGAVALHSAVCG
jgi:demethylmenaquinone methyltransferase/2-methoxy-6-polyprenyl-1,4-benzoquinol methylase